jgi:predicted RNase H-like nuclease (RuvC/YqgF family)
LEVTAVLTNEDFQALGQMMDERIGRLMEERLGQMMDEKLENKLAPIRADISSLTQRVVSLEEKTEQTNHNVRKLNQNVVVLEKEVRHDFKIICENSGDWNERNRQIDRLQKTQEDHHDRIWALEQVAKASNQ